MKEKTMSAADVIDFIKDLGKQNIGIWIDGGWGVDALLGKRTRSHSDLDIVIQRQDLQKARELLERQGYQNVERDDSCPWNFVLGDDKGHEIDFHVIVIDDAGNGIYGPPEKGVMYPAGSLLGHGTIHGHPVKCIAPKYMVSFHTGYKLRERDYKDVTALCKKFGIALPEEYIR
jgi:lincosamide nucleotidyltransferase A/C/D/E